MSTCNPRRVTRTSAERTLAALAHGAPRRDEPVAELLSALVPPSLERETAGERHALSALRTARQTPIARRRGGTLVGRVRQLLTIKVAVAAALLAASGIAVAAGSGDLARALNGSTAGSAPRPPAAAGAQGAAGQSASRSTSHSTTPVEPGPTLAATAALTASCREFDALDSDDQRTALAGQAFADLVQAAHGRKHVSAFCAALLAGRSPELPVPSGSAAVPTHPARPTHPAHPVHPSHPTHPSRPNS